MASTPVLPAPTAPVVTPAPVLPTVHSATDAMANRLAAAMHANQPSQPSNGSVPGPIQPPLATPPATTAPETTPAAPADAAPAVEPAPVVTEFDIENVDFDNPPVETTPATVEGQQPSTTPEKVPDSTIEGQLNEMLAKGEIPDKIEEVFLRHSRGKQMLTAFKTLRELAKPPAEGGIGRVPTLDEIRSADESHRTAVIMRDEFQNNPESFIRNMLYVDPNTGINYFGGMDHVKQAIQSIPKVLGEVLASGDPQARAAYGELYATYSVPVFNNFLNYQYNVALAMPQSTNQEIAEKARWLDALQLVEYRIFNKARPLNLTPNNGNGQPQGQPNQPDPEKQQLMQRLTQAETALRTQGQQRAQSIMQSVESQAATGALSDIDTVIKTAGLDKAYGQELLTPLKNELFREVDNVLEMHDPGGFNTYKLQVQQAARGQVDASVPANTYRQLFRNALRGNSGIRERMSNLVKGAKSSLDAQTTSLANSQSRVEPNGSGIPARGSVLPGGPVQLDRQPNESREEYTARKIRAASEGVTVRR
jgi:hypothetical protein